MSSKINNVDDAIFYTKEIEKEICIFNQDTIDKVLNYIEEYIRKCKIYPINRCVDWERELTLGDIKKLEELGFIVKEEIIRAELAGEEDTIYYDISWNA